MQYLTILPGSESQSIVGYIQVCQQAASPGADVVSRAVQFLLIFPRFHLVLARELAGKERVMKALILVCAMAVWTGAAFGLGADGSILRGDANNDNSVDSSDPVVVYDYLFLGGYDPSCLDQADANDDGAVDQSDVVYLLTYLLQQGPPPQAPLPSCGEDPTSDSLGCVDSQCN
jgi:hypothetical protein